MKRLCAVFLLASLAAAGMAASCGGGKEKPVAPAPAAKAPKLAAGEVSFVEDEELEGMRLRLRELGAPRDEQPRLAGECPAAHTGARLVAGHKRLRRVWGGD